MGKVHKVKSGWSVTCKGGRTYKAKTKKGVLKKLRAAKYFGGK